MLDNYRHLLKAPYDLNQEQIVTTAGHNGGSKNIEVVRTGFSELQNLGLTAKQIVTIAEKNGGSRNIQAVQKVSYN